MTRLKYILPTVLVAFPSILFAQGNKGPLTMQGLDKNTLHSAASRAMGGITLGLKNDIGTMFYNPAQLISLERPQISIGAQQSSHDTRQDQHYAPVRYYSNFSLLMESITNRIPDPAPEKGGSSEADTVQRPYDTIGPNWARSNDRTNAVQGLIAVPFMLNSMKLVFGAGAVQYADLHHYYQNNNALSPDILSQRPIPTFRPADNDPLTVYWAQYTQSRDGVLNGYGVALSGGTAEGDFSFGISGLFINGTSDDMEQEIGRGNIVFFANSFRLDSTYKRSVASGTSEYTGQEFTLSAQYKTPHVSIGASAKLPTIITRSFSLSRQVDTTGIASITTINGEDKIQLPWRGTVALSLKPRDNLTLGLEYELRAYESAVYTPNTGTENSPWLSASVFHVGAEYIPLPWLALRGGIRGQAEVFESEGNPLPGEPVTYSVYSAGVGVLYGNFQLNLTYEHALMKYQDIWGSAVSMNSNRVNLFVADLQYALPWGL